MAPDEQPVADIPIAPVIAVRSVLGALDPNIERAPKRSKIDQMVNAIVDNVTVVLFELATARFDMLEPDSKLTLSCSS
jgi:hypothetical protein